MAKRLQKRYQRYTSNGKEWSAWFNYKGERVKYQLKPSLLNEYREVDIPDNKPDNKQKQWKQNRTTRRK